MNTFADLCGVSGLGNGPGGRGCNLFNPGVFSRAGACRSTTLYEAGSAGYKTEYDNFAPNVGVAWQPNVQRGWLRALLGDPDLATLRASYGVAYNSDGLGFYRDVYNANPGQHGVDDRDRRRARSSRSCRPGRRGRCCCASRAASARRPGIPTEPVYPMAINFNNGVNLFDPAFRTPLVAIVLGRPAARAQPADGGRGALRRHAAGRWHDDGELELRQRRGTTAATGTSRATASSTSSGWRSRICRSRSPRAAASRAGPRARSRIRGPAPARSPLPIYLANFNGVPRAQAGDAARYTGTNWTNTARLDELAARNPEPGRRGQRALRATPTFRANLEAAGFPRNFFVLNPDVNNANITTNGGFTKYDSLQINLRRLLSGGLTLDANYTFCASATNPRSTTCAAPRRLVTSTDGVPHALKVTANYELPFGQRQAVRRRTRTRWVDGVDRRLVAEPDRARAERQHPQLRQRARRRHVAGRAARRVQDPHRSGDEDRLHAAAGHHRQHDQGVQHQRHVGHRLRRARRADRPLPGAGQRPGLHPGRCAATARRTMCSSKARSSRAST